MKDIAGNHVIELLDSDRITYFVIGAKKSMRLFVSIDFPLDFVQ